MSSWHRDVDHVTAVIRELPSWSQKTPSDSDVQLLTFQQRTMLESQWILESISIFLFRRKPNMKMSKSSFTILDQIDLKNCFKRKLMRKSEILPNRLKLVELETSKPSLQAKWWHNYRLNFSHMVLLLNKSTSWMLSCQEISVNTSCSQLTMMSIFKNKLNNKPTKCWSSIMVRTKNFFSSREITYKKWWLASTK